MDELEQLGDEFIKSIDHYGRCILYKINAFSSSYEGRRFTLHVVSIRISTLETCNNGGYYGVWAAGHVDNPHRGWLPRTENKPKSSSVAMIVGVESVVDR